MEKDVGLGRRKEEERVEGGKQYWYRKNTRNEGRGEKKRLLEKRRGNRRREGEKRR